MSLAGLPPPVVDAVAPLHEALRAHPIYARVESLPRLATFMERHVFAVWDFMSLLKRLQRDLTVVDVPWVPTRDPATARLINEIVLAEESDVVAGRVISHFALYREAMLEVGANTGPIDAFVDTISSASRTPGQTVGDTLPAALATIPVEGCRRFVDDTLRTARQGTTLEVAASFLLGREDIIPVMFSRLRAALPARASGGAFVAYLERHIEVDADEHGPAATELLQRLIDGDEDRAAIVATAASAACRSRLRLWDDIAAAL